MQENIQYSKLNYANSQYPDLLRESSGAPKHLYVRGVIPTQPMIAIVGSRKPTSYGREVTEMLAGELAQAGCCIVSGLALGIDEYAHKAALQAGGATLAVLGCGIDHIYPTSNQKLGEQIISAGHAIISEHPPGTPAFKHHFPARNRIIAGLSHAVIVTEADAQSGSLHTVKFALQYNRQVMAVPGNITSPRSNGSNNILFQGGLPVRSASDVLDALTLPLGQVAKLPVASTEQERTLINLLESGVTDNQKLIEHSKFTASMFAQTMSLMEITGKVRNLGGGKWALSRR